jgi:hypothetical protein
MVIIIKNAMLKKYWCKHDLFFYNKNIIFSYWEGYGTCYKITIPIACHCLDCSFKKTYKLVYNSPCEHYDCNDLWRYINKYKFVARPNWKWRNKVSKIIKKSKKIDIAMDREPPLNMAYEILTSLKKEFNK